MADGKKSFGVSLSIRLQFFHNLDFQESWWTFADEWILGDGA